MSALRRICVVIFLIVAASTLKGQSISGSTTVDIDPDTGMVTATCETDVDWASQGYYEPTVVCQLTDGAGNVLASGQDVDSSNDVSAIVVLQIQGVPGTTYTATGQHLAELSVPTDAPEGDPCGFCQIDEYNFQEISNEFFNDGVPYDYPVTFYGPGPEEETPAHVILIANTMASGHWTCFAQLKYRAVTPALGISIGNHSFWWIQNSSGKQYIIDGGPQNAGCYINCGYLVDWVTPGTVGHYPEDQIGAGTWFDSGTSTAVCTQVDALETAARNWPQTQTIYFVPGPNSNTFAHAMATSGNFAATQPPSATGW